MDPAASVAARTDALEAAKIHDGFAASVRSAIAAVRDAEKARQLIEDLERANVTAQAELKSIEEKITAVKERFASVLREELAPLEKNRHEIQSRVKPIDDAKRLADRATSAAITARSDYGWLFDPTIILPIGDAGRVYWEERYRDGWRRYEANSKRPGLQQDHRVEREVNLCERMLQQNRDADGLPYLTRSELTAIRSR
jgi:hypothetical protein